MLLEVWGCYMLPGKLRSQVSEYANKKFKRFRGKFKDNFIRFKKKKKSKDHQAINLGIYLEEEDEEEKKALLFVSYMAERGEK